MPKPNTAGTKPGFYFGGSIFKNYQITLQIFSIVLFKKVNDNFARWVGRRDGWNRIVLRLYV